MIVDLVVRSDAFTKGGGDQVQAEAYLAEFSAIGVDARLVPFSTSIDFRPGAVVQYFNIDRGYEFIDVVHQARGRRLFVSSIHHSMAFVREMRNRERGLNARGVLAALPESFRELITYVRRLLVIDTGSSSARVRAALRAVLSLPRYRQRIRHGLLAADGVLVLSRTELDTLQSDFRCELPNSVLTPNGAGPSTELVPWAARDRRILVVGRIEPRKRQLEVLRAAEALGIGIEFAGALNPNSGAYAAAFSDEISRSASSRWLGVMTHADTLALMGASRVLLNLSWVEVQSLVDLEAATAGCFVVATAGGSSREHLGEVVTEVHRDRIDDALHRAAELRDRVEGPGAIHYPHTWHTTTQTIAAVMSGSVAS